jgi:GxxExxY protein
MNAIPANNAKDANVPSANGKLLYPEESYAIVGACFNVYNDKGCGFLEGVYQECLEIEFEQSGIAFVAQKEFRLSYRERVLRQTFKVDFVCGDKIIVEIKAMSALVDEHRAQLLNYLYAADCQLGILVNFGHFPKLEYERLALSMKTREPRVSRLVAGNRWKHVDWK